MPIGPLSQPGGAAKQPDTPVIGAATATAGGGATVAFTASTNPGKGSASYVATSNPGGFTASAASSPITFTAGTLVAATAYTFTVIKQSSSGVSSDLSSSTGSITAFYVPNAPGSVTATATGTSKQITVSWATPSNNGSAITGYYIDYSPSSSFSASVTTTTSAAGTTSKTITDSGWTNGTDIYFRVRAENAAGQSANSVASSDYPYAPPSFGANAGSSTATAPTNNGTTTVSSVSTTTATLGITGLNGGTLIDYERTAGTGGTTPSAASLTGLSEKAGYTWRARVQNNNSTFALATKVTPNGSTTTVSVEYGVTTGYGTNAGSANIGASNSEQTSNFNLSSASSTAATIYYRITATYRGGTVTSTGSIARATSTYYATGVSFTTYGTYTRTSAESPSGITVTKPSNGVNITNISISMVGGGGGGSTTGSSYPRGGGGGGQVKTISGYTSTGTMTVSAPGAGGSGGFGGNGTTWTYYSFPGGTYTTVTAQGGTYGAGSQGGASPTDSGYNYGYNPSIPTVIGGGGGGSAGAATGADGGPATTVGSETWGRGGAGYVNTGFGTPSHADDSCTAGRGKGGRAAEGGNNGNADSGYWTITYTGPAFS